MIDGGRNHVLSTLFTADDVDGRNQRRRNAKRSQKSQMSRTLSTNSVQLTRNISSSAEPPRLLFSELFMSRIVRARDTRRPNFLAFTRSTGVRRQQTQHFPLFCRLRRRFTGNDRRKFALAPSGGPFSGCKLISRRFTLNYVERMIHCVAEVAAGDGLGRG